MFIGLRVLSFDCFIDVRMDVYVYAYMCGWMRMDVDMYMHTCTCMYAFLYAYEQPSLTKGIHNTYLPIEYEIQNISKHCKTFRSFL